MAKFEPMKNLSIVPQEAVAPKAEAPCVKRYTVLEEARIARLGSHYILPKGKIISNQGYDIDELERLGAKLEEVVAPS